jgi:hypothetical protein
VTSCLESIFIVIILSVWLWCGVRLQMHVVDVSFRPEAERRILFVINIVMGCILLSNLLRAVMILSLFLEESFKIHIYYSFLCWVVGTRWIPYIFCSALLIMIMQRSFGTLGRQDTGDGQRFRASQKQFNTHGQNAGNRDSAGSNNTNNISLKEKHNVNGQPRILSQGSSDPDEIRSSFLSQGSFALYVPDYDGGLNSITTPVGSFSNIGATDLEGPGTPLLDSIHEEDTSTEDLEATRETLSSGRGSSQSAPTSIAVNNVAVISNGGHNSHSMNSGNCNGAPSNNFKSSTSASISNSRLNRDVSISSTTSSLMLTQQEIIMSLSSIEAYSDDAFGNESSSTIKTPLLRRELSVTSDTASSWRVDRKSSV